MRNCAILCEYNPFHTGHKYQLERVRQLGADEIFCVMSGNFVQSAMPAFCDKSIRVECAIRGGADAVIELPVIYATASAGYFADGALKLMSGIKGLTHMAMGACTDPENILRIYDVKRKKHAEAERLLREELDGGRSYNAANAIATAKLFAQAFPGADITDILSEPNNILCLEYLRAIETFAPGLDPLIIERRGAAHNDMRADGEHVSATAIRTAFENGAADTVMRYVPFMYDDIIKWRELHAPDMSPYKKIAMFALKRATPEKLSGLRDCTEGMEYLLHGLSDISDHEGYVKSATCKRYGKKRIDRILLSCVLDIDKGLMSYPFCTRLLGCRSGLDFRALPECVKTNNSDIKNAAKSDSRIARVLEVDEAAAQLYNTIAGIDGDYYNYSLVKL